MKIIYGALIKNPKRKTAPFYGRVRQDGKERYIPLHTQDKAEAMKWVEKQNHVLFEVNEYLDAGQEPPPELLAKLVTLDSVVIPRKVKESTVGAPGSLLEKWETDLRVNGLRPMTVTNYTKAIRFLLGNEKVSGLSSDTVKRIVASTVNMSPNTRRFYFNAMKSLFRFMGRMDLIKALPTIRPVESSHVYWSELDMADIIAEVSSDTAERTLQYQDYFGVLAAIGSRNTETFLLKWENLNDDQSITFPAAITKANKTRTVPIPYNLWAQLEVRRGKPEERIFNLVSPSQSRRYRVLQRAIDKLGLPGSGLHMFRRSRSVLLYKKVKNIKVCAALLGDSEEVALKHYQDAVTIEEVRKAAFDE